MVLILPHSYESDCDCPNSDYGTISRRADVFFGIPEGSVFSRILFILYSGPLCSLTETQSVPSQSFADDTQLLQSCPLGQIHATVLTMQPFISDVTTWMTQNKLKVNDDMTQVVLIKYIEPLFPTLSPRTCLRAGTADILCSQPRFEI